MTNFFDETIKLEPLMGSHISSVAEEAVKIANFLQATVCFVFSDVKNIVPPGRTVENVVQSYYLTKGITA